MATESQTTETGNAGSGVVGRAAAGYTAVPTASLAYLVGLVWRAWAALDHGGEERLAGDLHDAIDAVVSGSAEVGPPGALTTEESLALLRALSAAEITLTSAAARTGDDTTWGAQRIVRALNIGASAA